MHYVKMSFNYGKKFSEREQKLLQQVALTFVAFDEAGELKSERKIVLPWPIAKMLDRSDSIDVYEIYSEEEMRAMAMLFEDKVVMNERTGAAVPSDALTRVREVELYEDCCTDILKERLQDGWSILAICPQPQRRPDYILGKIPPRNVEKVMVPMLNGTTLADAGHDKSDNIPF